MLFLFAKVAHFFELCVKIGSETIKMDKYSDTCQPSVLKCILRMASDGLVVSEHHDSPIVSLEGLFEREVILTGCLFHLWHIFGEETGDDELALWCKMLHVGGHIVGEDVLVDVGNDGVELILNGCGIALQDACVVDFVEGKVLTGVLHTEGIYVDGYDFLSAPLRHGNAKHTSASAHVEHTLGGEILLEQEGGDLVGGFVRTRAKCHAWVEPYAKFTFEDRVKTVLLPFSVPVFVLQSVERVGECHIWDEDVSKRAFEDFFIELVFWNVCLDTRVGHFEGIIADLSEQGGEYIAGDFGVGGDGNVCVEVKHRKRVE